MSNLADVMHLRTWKYIVRNSNGDSYGPYLLNENLTGAVLGDQRPARITFRSACVIIASFNHCGDFKQTYGHSNAFRLLIPLT